MKLKKQNVTLIEVLIATILTMILLTAIASLYRQVTIANKQSEILQKEHFKLTYLEKRLSTVIPKIISPNDPNKDFYFFTTENYSQDGSLSLVFTYDRGVSLDKNQSNHLLGRLFLDRDKNLVLASWISPKRWGLNENLEVKKEILCENVSDLSFEFYVPQKKDRSEIVASNPSNSFILQENHWHKNWSPHYEELPAMMKIHFTKKAEEKEIPVTFAFSLPKSNLVIFYDN